MKNPKEGIDYLKTSSKPYAYLGFREILIYSMLINGPKFFYLAPKTDESSFILQHFGIAMHKRFKYKNQFNKLYSNLDFDRKNKNSKSINLFIAFLFQEAVVLSITGKLENIKNYLKQIWMTSIQF